MTTMASVPSSRLLSLPPEIRCTILRHYCEITALELRASIRDITPAAVRGRFSYVETDKSWIHGPNSGLAGTCRQLRSEFIDQAVSRCNLVLDLPFGRPARTIFDTPNIVNTRLSKLVPTHLAGRITQAKVDMPPYEDAADYLFELANLNRWLPSLRTLQVGVQPMSISRALGKSDWNMADIVDSPHFDSSRYRHYEAQLHGYYGLLGRPEDRKYRMKVLSFGGLYRIKESNDIDITMVCWTTPSINEITDEDRN